VTFIDRPTAASSPADEPPIRRRRGPESLASRPEPVPGTSSEEIVMFHRTRLWAVLVVAIGMAALLAMPEIAHAGIIFNSID